MPTPPPEVEMDGPPSCEELMQALSRLQKGKTSGKMWILPMLLLYGGVELQNRLLKIMEDMWKEGVVVRDWKDAEIVPIPKKGDLKLCNNW